MEINMEFNTKKDILNVLSMPEEEFFSEIAAKAKEIHRTQNGDKLFVSSMLGYSNVCKNQCLYCGMRAGNSTVPRYRIEAEEALGAISSAAKSGFKRLFLISGEDPGYSFEKLLRMVSGAKAAGIDWISLACGEFERSRYAELKAAGADEYVIKFEMSDPDTFNRLNPSTSFKARMRSIEAVKELGFALASGNIVDYPGQTAEQLADDILLMQRLGISWAPIVPYLPAKNTPLAGEGGPGSRLLNLKEIAILRISLPSIHITGGQPGKNLAEGFSSVDGTQAALSCGADMLFADLLPAARAEAFRVVDNRLLLGLEHIEKMAEMANMELIL